MFAHLGEGEKAEVCLAEEGSGGSCSGLGGSVFE